VKSLIEYHGGLPDLSKPKNKNYLGPSLWDIQLIINKVCTPSSDTARKVSEILLDDYSISFRILLDSPNPKNLKQCVIYYNPMGITVTDYFINSELCYTPRKIVDLLKCPIILFDYDGIGINQRNESETSDNKKNPISYSRMILNGRHVLTYAIQHFQHVHIWGTGIGANIALESLKIYSQYCEVDPTKLSMTLQDALSKAPPKKGKLRIKLTKSPTNKFSPKKAIKEITEKGIKIRVLFHATDQIISKKLSLAESLHKTPVDVSIIYGGFDFYGDLSEETMHKLEKANATQFVKEALLLQTEDTTETSFSNFS